MLHMMTDEEVAESQERNFRFVEPGFLVDMNNLHPPEEARFALVKEKDEAGQTLAVVPLTQSNILKLFSGEAPRIQVIGKDKLMNVHATAITDAMCREREFFTPHCATCKKPVYQWLGEQGGVDGPKNYRVGPDGLCRHIDCSDQQKRE